MALEKIGIENLRDRAFGQLSGGQKQMVLLARAIAQEVNVFIMDEPVAGLDYGNQVRLLELISELGSQGYTFLKTTHYPDHALLVSSRVVVMNGGVVISDGAPEDVISQQMIEDVYNIKADINLCTMRIEDVFLFFNKKERFFKMDLLFEDVGYFDLTTLGLNIGNEKGFMSFAPKEEIILCGVDEVKDILDKLEIKHSFFKNNGDKVMPHEIILECKAEAAKLHKAWKISQNIFEYMSGISTYTNKLVTNAKGINPNIVISTTRKNFPGAKAMMLKAVMHGGGAVTSSWLI